MVLVALLLHSSLISRGPQQGFLLSLALAPLVRLLSLSLPLIKFPFVYWYALVGVPLFIAAFLTARVIGLSRAQMGMTVNKPFLQILIGLTGLGLGYIEYLILHPDPLSEDPSLQHIWLPALILFIFTGFLEEYIFRGVMQYTSLRSLGRIGIFYVAAVFAVLHLGYKSVLDVVFVFCVAVFFSIATIKTGSILGVTISHGLTNIGLFLIFPFIIGTAKAPTLVVPASPTSTATRNPTVIFTSTPQPLVTKSPLPAFTASGTPTRTATPLPTLTRTATPLATQTPTLAVAPTQPLTVTVSVEATLLPTSSAVSPSLETTASPITLTQIVIDDGDLGFLRSGGEPYNLATAFGGDFIWALTASGNVSMQGEWRPVLSSCGVFELEVFIPSAVKLTHMALYQISYRQGMATVSVNQSTHPGEWVSLGQYEFQPTNGTYLRLNNETGEAPSPDLIIAFDASRWTYLKPCK